jgi:hypothetical protein
MKFKKKKKHDKNKISDHKESHIRFVCKNDLNQTKNEKNARE